MPSSRKRRSLAIITGGMLVETAGLWLQSRRIAGNVIVRCSQGHLFTTLWIPGASVKSLRLVWWRVQRCPVGGHFSLVRPVDESMLSEDERRRAHERHDLPVP